MNSRRGYPYRAAGPFYNGRSERGKKPRPSGHSRGIVFYVVVLVLLAAAFVFFLTKGKIFPTKLLALSFLHNGQEMLLLPGSQVVVNPRDTLQLTAVKTNGWLSWGIRVVSAEVDVRPVTTSPGVVIRELFPGESFETPKTIVFNVLLWNRPIGKVSFLVQLDYKDWLQKANTTPDLDRRIEYLQKALQDNSSNILIKTQLAGLYFDIKHYREAERLYRQINRSGKSKDISQRLLLVYQALNKPDQALQVYLDLMNMTDDQKTFDDFLAYLKKKKSVSQAESFLVKHERDIPSPFRSQAMVEIAEMASARKDWQGAARAWRSAERAGVMNSDVLYNLAVTLMRTGKTDAAIGEFEKYLRKNPNDAKTWALVASLSIKEGKFTRAKAIYESMVRKNPRNKQALVNLVALAAKTSDKAEEIDAYEKLLRIDPNNRKYLFNVSMLYIDQKNYDKALAPLKTVSSLAPKDVQYLKQLLLVYQKLNDAEGQTRVRIRLARLSPGDSANLDILYSSFAQKKDYKGMQAFFRGVEAQNPNAVNVHKYLLEAATKLGDNKSALHELDQLIRLQPKQKQYHRLAAYLYEKEGNFDAAARELKAILKIDFNDKKAQKDYERVMYEQLEHGSIKGVPKSPPKPEAKATASIARRGTTAGAGAKAKARIARQRTTAGPKRPPDKSSKAGNPKVSQTH